MKVSALTLKTSPSICAVKIFIARRVRESDGFDVEDFAEHLRRENFFRVARRENFFVRRVRESVGFDVEDFAEHLRRQNFYSPPCS